ncbi:MAG: glycerate kinase [Candidatus Hydrothermarchaeota archaeon]
MIKNKDRLIQNGRTEKTRLAREYALEILESAILAALPQNCIGEFLKKKDSKLIAKGEEFDLNDFENVYLVGAGKASVKMAEAVLNLVHVSSGVLVTPPGIESKIDLEIIEGGHPIPNEGSVRGARRVMSILKNAKEKDLVICVISGGGSALLCLPSNGIDLEDKQRVTEFLIKSGATINEINTVRKHISAIKGGQLAKAAYPSQVLTLILSDVVGDPLDVIASGPTVPDPTTFVDAKNVLKRYNLWDTVPEAVRKRIEKGIKKEVDETPKEADPYFDKIKNIIVGNNILSCKAAQRKAKELGLNSLILSSMIEGESREVGIMHAGIAREIFMSENPVKKPAAIISGGETTVQIKGKGKGGRNQEFALAGALKISNLDGVVIASVGTDGIDGVTDAAGAMVDGYTITKSSEKGLDPLDFLEENNSFEFFRQLEDLIYTGPTGTNVTDIHLIVSV